MANFGCDSTATTSENTGDGFRWSVGTFPATNGTLTDVRAFISGYSGGATLRFALYQGGTTTDPTGSSLVYDSDAFAYNVNPPLVWKGLTADFSKTVTGSLTASLPTFFAWKLNDAAVGLSNSAALNLLAGSAKDSSVSNSTAVAFPSTFPTASIVSGAEAVMTYIVYTASGGGSPSLARIESPIHRGMFRGMR